MDFKKLEELLDRFTAWRIPGCAAVVYHKGYPVFKYASGYADVENEIPMDADLSRLHMYSCSKPVTCACALMLWEEGRFLMSDPLYAYIPEWKNVKVREIDESGHETVVPARSPITIGDLFGMTSGLDYNTGGESFTRALKEKAPECCTVDMIKALAGDPMWGHPGKKWFYGMSHDVIGALIEVISGKTLQEFARKRIFDPLGMDDSSYGNDGVYRGKFAVQYNFDDEKGKFVKGSQDNWFNFGSKYFSGGAGIDSTVSDMAKFANMLSLGGRTADGKRLLAPTTVKLMKTNRLTREMSEFFDWNSLEGYGYGFGVRTLISPAAAGSPSPIGEFGWTGAAGAYLLVDTDNELAMYYAHHMLNNQEHYTTPRLRNTLYSCLD